MGALPDFGDYDALGLAELVKNKDVTPRELLDQAIERLEQVNPEINAVVIECYDHARNQIEAGLPEGPFRGVPFLLKDLHLLLKGTETSSGSAMFKGLIADHDSTLVTRYKKAGLAIFGKTNSPELGLTVTTEPKVYGPTRNPWNLNHIPGGSSGGAAAAVAARIIPMANASDGGGSIRLPAAACGIFGMKPTRARTPFGPDRGEGWNGFSISHAVSISVRDNAALLDATTGGEAGDPYPAPTQARPFLEDANQDPQKLRIAFNTVSPNGSTVHPECIKAVEDAAKLCASLGHDVEEARPEFSQAALGAAQFTIIGAHTAAALAIRGEALGRAPTQNDVEAATWSMLKQGQAVTAADYARAQIAVHQQSRIICQFFETYDVLIEPTFGLPPLKIGTVNMDSDDLGSYVSILQEAGPFTGAYNMTGQPSMSVPLHWSEDRLPIGTMFTAQYGEDGLLYQLAGQLERAQPWKDKIPPVHA